MRQLATHMWAKDGKTLCGRKLRAVTWRDDATGADCTCNNCLRVLKAREGANGSDLHLHRK